MEIYDGFIYLWTNTRNNKKYIGSHYGHDTDKYIGSGKYFRRAYKKEPTMFIRTILEYVIGDQNKILEREEYYLSLVPNIANNKEYYNLSSTAGGGRNHDHLSKEKQKEIIQKAIHASLEARKNMTEAEREELRIKKQKTWANNSKVREKHSINTKIRRLAEEARKTTRQKEEFKEKCKESYWSRSKEDIKKSDEKRSKSITEWHKNKDPKIEEQRIQKMLKTRKEKNFKWIYHSDKKERKQLPAIELQTWLDKGWKLGYGPRI